LLNILVKYLGLTERVSVPYELTERVQSINPVWGVDGFDPFVSGGIVSLHIAARTLCILAGLFHISVKEKYV
jgi:photosystem II CP47 chlorophyll apoprotein